MQAIGAINTAMPAEQPRFGRVTLALLFLFLLTEVLNGAIRHDAVQFGLPWLPYLPHMLLFPALIPMFFSLLLTEGITSAYLGVVVLFGVTATAVGSPKQFA